MSVSSEVQRTLVKSPPELWAELSDPDSLTRHLGELGEIRITSVEPETKVEWETDHASGTVQLKQSGWGTRVTLSVTRTPPAPEQQSEPEPEPVEASEPEAAAVDLERTVAPESSVEPDPTVEPESPEPGSVAEAVTTESDPEPVAVEPEPIATEPDPEPVATVEPGPQLRFFARLFRKRRAHPPATVEPEPVASVEREVEPDSEPEVVAMAMPEPIYPETPPEQVADLAAELAAVEEQMAQETTELLSGVLDRLGAAHHRPFSRG